MSEIPKIAKLLTSTDIEKQIAACIVLGELRAKSPETHQGLAKLLSSEVPAVGRNAAIAVSRIGAKKHLDQLFRLVASPSAEVRHAAASAIVSVGPTVVDRIGKRLEHAHGDERKVLDQMLAELGGADAFSALLAGLESTDPEAAKSAALAVRHEVKRADAKERRHYASQTEKFLNRKAAPSDEAKAAAIKLLGYLEDKRTLPTVVRFAGPSNPPATRVEALIALRFLADPKNPTDPVVDALLAGAEGGDRNVAQAALMSLNALTLAPKALKRLGALVKHADGERAAIAIEQLASREGADSAETLVAVLETGADRRRIDLALERLKSRVESVGPALKRLLETDDFDSACRLRNVLRAHRDALKPAMVKRLRERAIERLSKDDRIASPLLELAREADPKACALALRELAHKLGRSKSPERAIPILTQLSKSEFADDDDLYKLASLRLQESRLDTHLSARASDDSLHLLANLEGRGFDVASALKKDRRLDLDALYYVGFHFAEQRPHDQEALRELGRLLLEEVVRQGGRKKIAKMAKNKLNLVAS